MSYDPAARRRAVAPVPVPAVRHAIALIRALNVRAQAGARLPDLSAALGITRSHCHNILRTLVAEGWLTHEATSRAYRLAPGLAADVTAAHAPFEPLGAIRPALFALARAVEFPVLLSRPQPDGSFLVVDKVDGLAFLEVSAQVGQRFPPEAPAQARARLAWLPPEPRAAEVARWLALPGASAGGWTGERLEAELAATRARGYARSRGEFFEGVMGLGLPIFGADGEISLVLQCTGLIRGLEPEETRVARAMWDAVNDMHAAIGGRPPETFSRPCSLVVTRRTQEAARRGTASPPSSAPVSVSATSMRVKT
jgi:DNA-binding IclR family transcriptional regulator